MDRFSYRLFVPFIVVMMVSMACSFGSRAPAAVETGAVATSVAETIQALAKPVPAEVKPTAAAPAVPPTTAPEQAPTPKVEVQPPQPPALAAAYTDGDRNLWSWMEGGSSRQLVNTGNVTGACISSDGKVIVFTRVSDPEHYSLWSIGADGSNLQEILSTAELAAFPSDPEAFSITPASVKFIPGTHNLLFNTRPLYEGPGLAYNNDLWLIDVDSGEKRNLLPRGQGGMFSISPDGKQLALSTPQSISLVNADGSNLLKDVFKFESILTYSEYNYYPDPAWEKDAKNLRVVIPARAALENPSEPTMVWTIPLDGSSAVKTGSVVTSPLFFPLLSPNLNRLAYQTNFGKPEENRRDLNIANADGSGMTVVQTGQLTFVGWAPDSAHVVYTDNSTHTSYIIQAGSGAVLMPGGTLLQPPLWVDSSRYLAVFRGSAGWEIRLGTLDGGSTVAASFPYGVGTAWPVLHSNLSAP